MTRNSVRIVLTMIMCVALFVIFYNYGTGILQERHSNKEYGQIPHRQNLGTDTNMTNKEKDRKNIANVPVEIKGEMMMFNDEKKERKNIANVPVEIMDEMMMLNDEQAAQDDPRLIKLIRDHFIHPPSKEPYNLSQPDRTDYAGQGKDNVIPTFMKDSPDNGFFIECGAYDGEVFSSTLFFEKTRHFSGLLIEANTNLFKRLLRKRRKAYAVNACLSTKPYATTLIFNELDAIGRLVEGTFEQAYRYHNFKLQRNLVELQCFPLYSMLLALNQPDVDFFGLDIEGVELEILKTIPWDKVHITNLLAEVSHAVGGRNPTIKFLESKGYTLMKTLTEDVLLQKK